MLERVEFHPRLVEEAVFAALRGRPESRTFHRERDPIYREADPEERERRFAALHAAWFERLDLAAAVRAAAGEIGAALARARRVLIVPAAGAQREAAELYVWGEERSVVVALCPATLADPPRALRLLRRELLHVADMLDPAFGYEPRLPPQAAGPSHDRLLQERYRILWAGSVDGRLVRAGRLEDGARAARLSEFREAFACLGDAAEACFEQIVSAPRPCHRRLVAIALDPGAAFGLSTAAAARSRCPLCGFPSARFEPRPEDLPRAVRDAIRADFPGWIEADGLCPQCADLYRARPLSRGAADLLPGRAIL